jgi:hypothetical protein
MTDLIKDAKLCGLRVEPGIGVRWDDEHRQWALVPIPLGEPSIVYPFLEPEQSLLVEDNLFVTDGRTPFLAEEGPDGHVVISEPAEDTHFHRQITRRRDA